MLHECVDDVQPLQVCAGAVLVLNRKLRGVQRIRLSAKQGIGLSATFAHLSRQAELQVQQQTLTK